MQMILRCNHLAFAMLLPTMSCTSPDTTVVHIRNAVYASERAAEITPVTVRVHMSDVKEIASSQSYTHVVITNCTGDPSPYPLTPRLGAVQLTNYVALRDEITRRRDQDEADLTIEADSGVLRRFANPCVHISGGSYFGHRLTSNLVPLIRR